MVFAGVVVLNLATFAPPWMVVLPRLRFFQALELTQASTALSSSCPRGRRPGWASPSGCSRAGASPARDHPRDHAREPLEPVPQPRLPDRGGVPADGARRGDGAARHGRVHRRRDPGRGGHRVRAHPRPAGSRTRSGSSPPGSRTGRSARCAAARWAGAGELRALPPQRRRAARRRWHVLTLASLAGSLSVFLVLLVCLRALDVPASEVSAVEAFAAWSLVRLLGTIPITPGGSASSSSA